MCDCACVITLMGVSSFYGSAATRNLYTISEAIFSVILSMKIWRVIRHSLRIQTKTWTINSSEHQLGQDDRHKGKDMMPWIKVNIIL